MNSGEEDHSLNIENLLRSGATITFLFQLLSFFLSYNTSTEIITLGFGWILLAPGYAILLLAVPKNLDNDENMNRHKRPIYDYTKHPFEIGWSIFSIAITCISQSLISLTLTIVFLSFLILIVREDTGNT